MKTLYEIIKNEYLKNKTQQEFEDFITKTYMF